MQIKHLIAKLQELYDTYDDEYKEVMGEPEIMIDVFEESSVIPHYFQYKGFSPGIVIEKTDDGVYDILSCFKGEKDECYKYLKDDYHKYEKDSEGHNVL